jgi:hypothetical protein
MRRLALNLQNWLGVSAGILSHESFFQFRSTR